MQHPLTKDHENKSPEYHTKLPAFFITWKTFAAFSILRKLYEAEGARCNELLKNASFIHIAMTIFPHAHTCSNIL